MKVFGSFAFSIIFAAFFIFCFSTHASQPDSDCISWFKAGKAKPGTKACELDCAILMTDMGTFMCPNQCDMLCKGTGDKSILGKIVYYPGLTPAEKKLVEKNPEDAVTAFIQKTRAEWSSGRNFPEQGLNDEGDMDQFNNEKGSSTAQSLISDKKWSLENLEKSGLDSLRSKNLKVLSPGLKIPEVPK